MLSKNKSPIAHGGDNRASKQNRQDDFTEDFDYLPPPQSLSQVVKKYLVGFGAKGFIPKRLIKGLINFLGLRGE